MVVAAGALVAAGLGLTVLAGPVYGYAQRAADALTDGHSYVDAVWEFAP
jgi:multicomponent Na+:H+ antiporter subunit D